MDVGKQTQAKCKFITTESQKAILYLYVAFWVFGGEKKRSLTTIGPIDH